MRWRPRRSPLGIQYQTFVLPGLHPAHRAQTVGQPRAVKLDKNNCKEGREEGQSEAVQPFKVTWWVKGLRSCSPRIPCSWLCSEAVS